MARRTGKAASGGPPLRSNWLRGNVLLIVSVSLVSAGSSQRGIRPATPPPPANSTSSPLIYQETEPFPDAGGRDDTPLSILAREARMRQEERQKHLTADTARLVELSKLLQAEVNRSGGKNVLSLENLRRTEEIEKLARKVRERMKS